MTGNPAHAVEILPAKKSSAGNFVKYIMVGALNSVFGYSLFAFFIFIKVHYPIAVLLTTLLGIAFNFKTIGKLVFKNNDNKLIFRFTSVYVLTYLLNVGGLHLLSGYQLNMYLSGAILIMPIALISFIFHKGFVFRNPQRITTNATY